MCTKTDDTCLHAYMAEGTRDNTEYREPTNKYDTAYQMLEVGANDTCPVWRIVGAEGVRDDGARAPAAGAERP